MTVIVSCFFLGHKIRFDCLETKEIMKFRAMCKYPLVWLRFLVKTDKLTQEPEDHLVPVRVSFYLGAIGYRI